MCTVDHVQYHRVHTEWQLPVSGVHSIMMEKLAQPGDGAGARPPPYTLSTITHKVAVYAPAERADTFLLFLLSPYLYSVLSYGEKPLPRAAAFVHKRTFSPTD
jgi:hypothetical protein